MGRVAVNVRIYMKMCNIFPFFSVVIKALIMTLNYRFDLSLLKN